MDQDKSRDFRRKKIPIMREKEEKLIKRPIILMKSKDNEKSTLSKADDVPIPTILLKTRDVENRGMPSQTSTSAKAVKDIDGPTYQLAPKSPISDLANMLSAPPVMKNAVKLLDDETQAVQDGLLEYLTDSTDFLVVGCIGLQGVGKSTILSHLANPYDLIESEELVFKKQSSSQIDSACHGTDGIDAYITDERVILLDSQPLLSLSVLRKHYNSDVNLSARSCSRDDPDYPCMESDMELLSLQYVSFLLTVCHVVIVVQEYINDPEIIRFLLTAEMLKPFSGHSDEDSVLEYFPHIMLVHNKLNPDLFRRDVLHHLQEFYKVFFKESHLQIQSGIGIANGNVLKALTPELCESEPINLFFLPKFQKEVPTYENIAYPKLLRDLRLQIYGLAPAPLTQNTVLTEKNWWHYAGKIWEDIKKSTLFPEFGRIIATPALAKELSQQT